MRTTGYGLLRQQLWVQSTATAAATMLLCDALLDTLSANDSCERLVAVFLSLAVELPTAVLCLLVARHVEEVAERAQRYALVARRIRPRRGTDATRSRSSREPPLNAAVLFAARMTEL